MSRSVARLVALFFLFATGADICHPCVEKLERVGLLPDHSQFPFQHSNHYGTKQEDKREDPPANQPAKDDDCLCCRTDVMVEPMTVDVNRSEYFVPAFLQPAPKGIDHSVSVQTYSHSPPLGGLRLEATFDPPGMSFRRLRKILSEDLLPPPSPIRQS